MVSASDTSFISFSAISYTGASQTITPSGFNTNSHDNASSVTVTTTVVDGAWTVMHAQANSSIVVAGAVSYDRSVGYLFDSGPMSPAGATSMTGIRNGSGVIGALIASFAPAGN